MSDGDPNSDSIDYWNDCAGPRWAANAARIDAQLGAIGRLAQERAGVGSGDVVLDVGCGCGGATLELAERVGPDGCVFGMDVSRVMLETARQRALARGLDQVGFVKADAQVHPFRAEALDHVYSRFGVMFFSDPVRAFSNMRGALRTEGRLTFVCWADRAHNAWFTVPREAAARHVELPEPDDEAEPGPFAFARPLRIRAALDGGGFVNAEFEQLDGDIPLGGARTVEQAVEFSLGVGVVAAALDGASSEVRVAVAEELREVFEPYFTPDGVRMPYRAWLVRAVRGVC